ncbi:Fc.00g073430.m01.CDS01 [Cosmosporella sp. VM-42]
MARLTHLPLFFLALTGTSLGHLFERVGLTPDVSATPNLKKLARRDDDPSDFSWVKKFAAIGDSFTAGIGAGNALGSRILDDQSFECSRYDQTWPKRIWGEMPDGAEQFQYLACSGDRSTGIYKQIDDLDDDQDLVVLTAGGNDLCLSGMIWSCIINGFSKEQSCSDVIDKAQENLDNILKPNLVQILEKLDDKMAKDSIVVFSGYAQYFNTEEESCGDDEVWSLFTPNGLKLTLERRKRFNDLVVQINDVIKDAIEEARKTVKNYYIGFSNWDRYPREGVRGQYCDPHGTGVYPDPKQPNLQFFKLNTPKTDPNDELRRRELSPRANITNESLQKREEQAWYNSILYKSPNPEAVALHLLDPRAPSGPDCPGDGGVELSVPDFMGKIFHPNEAGHATMASFALSEIVDIRARVLGQTPDSCKVPDEWTCWSEEGWRAYATASRLDETYRTFCDEVELEDGGKTERTFDEGTPDEHLYFIDLAQGVSFDKDRCKDSFTTIIHSCDTDSDSNPMNWKGGGRWMRDESIFKLNIKRENRPARPKEASGHCEGWWKVAYSDYHIQGAGFISWDGKNDLWQAIDDCAVGITDYHFEYFDEPDENGYEWKAHFHMPVFVKARCFENNKVVFSIDGNAARSFEWNEDDPGELFPGAWPLDEVYTTCAHSPEKHLPIPQVGGRQCNLAWHHPPLERLLLIGSAWGLFQWLLRDAVKRGWKLEVCANSDEHRGRSGGGVPGTAVFCNKGGLAGVLTDKLEWKQVGETLRARRRFATTGERLVGLVSARNGSVLQGDELTFKAGDSPNLKYAFTERDADGCILHRDLQQETSETGAASTPRKLRVEWGGARLYGTYREAVWHGSITITGAAIAHFKSNGADLDNPEDVIEKESDSQVVFDTHTSGDFDGADLFFTPDSRGPSSISVTGQLRGYVKVGNARQGDPHKAQSDFSLLATAQEAGVVGGKLLEVKSSFYLLRGYECASPDTS